MKLRSRLALSLFASLAPACLPGPSVVLSRADDAAADAPVADAPVADARSPDASPDASPPDASPDVAPDVAPPMTDEVWPARAVPAAIGCDVGAWCWQHPNPQGEAVFDALALSASDVWAVGGRGLAMHWDGAAWAFTRTGTTANIYRVWGTRRDDVWVTTLETDPGGTNATGQLLHWVGDRWVGVAVPFTQRPAAVHGSGPYDVWVSTQSNRSTESGSIWRYDGTRWSEMREGLPAGPFTALDLWVEQAGRVWMYGRASGEAHAYSVYRHDGARWALVEDIRDSVSDQAFTGRIAGAGAEVFLLSGGINGDRASYTVRISQSPFRFERSSAARSHTDTLVAAGGGVWYLGGSELYRRDAGAWVAAGPALDGDRVRAVTAFAASDAATGWGFNYYADTFRRVGGAWLRVSGPTKPVFRGVVTAQGAVLAYGSGGAFELPLGETWTPRTGALADAAEVVTDATRATVVIRTSMGRLVLEEAGAERDITPPMATVAAAATASAGVVWAVANNRVTQWDGARWQEAPALPARVGDIDTARADLRFVAALGADVFVAGGVRRVELENDYTDFLCRLRAGAWTCAAIAETRPFMLYGSNFTALAASPTGGLWGLVAGRLTRFDAATLSASTVGLSTGEGSFSTLAVGPGGELVTFANGIIVLHPATRAAERYELPTSGYAGRIGVAGVGPDGSVYAAGPNGELLRHRVR